VTPTIVDTILNRALAGAVLSPEEAVVLLQQTESSAIAAIRSAADSLRHRQASHTVTCAMNGPKTGGTLASNGC
jgi:FO synthase subunit 2